MLAPSPTAIEDLQLLASKTPPPCRLRNEINNDILFHSHDSIDKNPKLSEILKIFTHPQANSAICLEPN